MHKGTTTETVQVAGKERGMSRKKAEKLISRGRAAWVQHGLLQITTERV